jgi:hypothetical protein
MNPWDTSPVAAALVAELSRLVTEYVDRVDHHAFLPSLGTLQAIAARSEDLAEWTHALLQQSLTPVEPAMDEPAPAGAYL